MSERVRNHDVLAWMHVPQPIRALLSALPNPGTPMHKLRKQQFLSAVSALLNMYYPDKDGKP